MAEFSIISFAAPGRTLRPIGILLIDAKDGQILVQCKRNWEGIADDEDVEVLKAFTSSLVQLGRDLGAAQLIEYLESTLSNAIRITDRAKIHSTNLDQTLEDLYTRYVDGSTPPFLFA